ncbi:hypothetical protein LTR05_005424 [Lithohypha guttulata]|uniref:NmrA-like domain-containing protein n=1 Tax=Lithohypha guttulata TaxID=1690604 RepID=A0AAN7SXS1_9EURO|nr:hypothetical protein LTR05_005424 [Lithohypha guttulata]
MADASSNIIPLTESPESGHKFDTVALFGSNGQIGSFILQSLVDCRQQSFKVLAFTQPDTPSPREALNLSKSNKDTTIEVKPVDLMQISQSELADQLKGVDVIVSALNGKALESQKLILEAAVDAGVKRIYPSEYGMHHVYTQNDGSGWVHPLWNMKANANEDMIKHPAVFDSKISYTLIGCGDYYNQDREPIWCPWTQSPSDVKDNYILHVAGDQDATADFTHLADFAEFLVVTLCKPEASRNRSINVVSDSISHSQIAKLLEKYTGKQVKIEKYNYDDQRKILSDPKSAPKELRDKSREDGEGQSAFPVDFWFLVKGMQGAGKFRWPIGERHETEFGLDAKNMRNFDWYFRTRNGKDS